MENSMDTILVKYGISLNKEEQDLINFAFEDEEKKKAEELTSQIKTATVPEFLAIDPQKLSETERDIQRAMREVYNLNGKEPPLYHKFPTFRSDTQPLTIDITTAGNNKSDYAAAYGVRDNRITFEDIDNPNFLVLTLAHELKHAEQADERGYQWYERAIDGFSMENAYAWHQQEFLQEAQAYALDGRVYCEVFGHANDIDAGESKLYEEISKKYTNSDGQKDHKKIEEKMITVLLDKLYNGKSYKDSYDMHAPIGENDKGIEQIPEVFHLSQDLMAKLKETPRLARSLNGKLFQADKNGHLDQYIKLLHESVVQNEEVSPSLRYIFQNGSLEQVQDVLNIKKQDGDYLFTDENVNSEFSASKDPKILKYLLSTNRDNHPLIYRNTISEQLAYSVQNVEDFDSFVKCIQNEKGQIPLTEKDFVNEFGNKLLSRLSTYSDEDRANLLQLLPKIMKLKGTDGKLLVGESHLSEGLAEWVKDMGTPENIQTLFDGIKDEKGNLPISREAFDMHNSEYEHMNGQNQLLYQLQFRYTEEDKKYASAILPTLIALKDKDGKPIISQENIDRFPENDDLASIVKSYTPPQTNSPSSRPKLSAILKKASCKPEVQKEDKTSTIINTTLVKNRRQAGG